MMVTKDWHHVQSGTASEESDRGGHLGLTLELGTCVSIRKLGKLFAPGLSPISCRPVRY